MISYIRKLYSCIRTIFLRYSFRVRNSETDSDEDKCRAMVIMHTPSTSGVSLSTRISGMCVYMLLANHISYSWTPTKSLLRELSIPGGVDMLLPWISLRYIMMADLPDLRSRLPQSKRIHNVHVYPLRWLISKRSKRINKNKLIKTLSGLN